MVQVRFIVCYLGIYVLSYEHRATSTQKKSWRGSHKQHEREGQNRPAKIKTKKILIKHKKKLGAIRTKMVVCMRDEAVLGRRRTKYNTVVCSKRSTVAVYAARNFKTCARIRGGWHTPAPSRTEPFSTIRVPIPSFRAPPSKTRTQTNRQTANVLCMHKNPAASVLVSWIGLVRCDDGSIFQFVRKYRVTKRFSPARPRDALPERQNSTQIGGNYSLAWLGQVTPFRSCLFSYPPPEALSHL